MIAGSVNHHLEASLPVDIIVHGDAIQTVATVVDTGFSGELVLQEDIIRRLGLNPIGRRTFELANGELFDFDTYLATISWHGDRRLARVLQSEGEQLVGMSLLRGSRVTIDVWDGGEVTVVKVE